MRAGYKYKAAEAVDQTNVNQVVTYAEAMGCHGVVLIYPAPLARPLDVKFTRICVRSTVFSLDGDLEQQGRQFLRMLEPILRSGT